MSKVKFIIALYGLFSGAALASPKSADPINIASTILGFGTSSFKSPNHAGMMVRRAHELIGTPYSWGGASVSKGFDCSGLLVYLFKSKAGIHIPRTTSLMLGSASKMVDRAHLKSGDIVFLSIMAFSARVM